MRRTELNLNEYDKERNTLMMRLFLENNLKEEEEINYNELKKIIMIILNDFRTDIFMKNNEGKSVRNITTDKNILKILGGKI